MEFFFHVCGEFILNFFLFCGSVSHVVEGDPEPYFAVGWGIAKQRLSGLYPVREILFELFSKKFFFPKFCVRHFGSLP